MVLCLDILGNFSHVHTEWKNEVGSGWSPAYNVTSLLVNLQATLCNLDSSFISISKKREFIKKCNNFKDQNSKMFESIGVLDEFAILKKSLDSDFIDLIEKMEIVE